MPSILYALPSSFLGNRRNNMRADCNGHTVERVGLRPPTWWNGGFESRQAHGCLCLVSVVCRPSGWSLVQRSPSECGVSECDRAASIMRMPWLTRSCCIMGRGRGTVWGIWNNVRHLVWSSSLVHQNGCRLHPSNVEVKCVCTAWRLIHGNVCCLFIVNWLLHRQTSCIDIDIDIDMDIFVNCSWVDTQWQ
jgi:hypothetical protein